MQAIFEALYPRDPAFGLDEILALLERAARAARAQRAHRAEARALMLRAAVLGCGAIGAGSGPSRTPTSA